MTYFIGIDPGKGGAIALLSPQGEIITVADMPTVNGQVSHVLLAASLLTAADHYANTDRLVIAIEAVHSMPKQGGASTFKFGRSYGATLGAAAMLTQIREDAGEPSTVLLDPTPQTWKRHHGLIGKDKEASRALALNLWPGHAADLFPLKKHEGRAEAALIARWAKDTQ